MNTVNQIGIYNMALATIGVSKTIQTLGDTSVQKIVCDTFWESVRDQCLSDFPWGFAMRYNALQLLSLTVPNWQYCYGYPADCLATRQLYVAGASPAVNPNDSLVALWLDDYDDEQTPLYNETPIPFAVIENEVAGGLAIATDTTLPILKYTARILSYSLWSPAFVNCAMYLMASKIVGPLANNPKYATDLGQAYQLALLKAGANSMNEGQSRGSLESEFITTRG